MLSSSYVVSTCGLAPDVNRNLTGLVHLRFPLCYLRHHQWGVSSCSVLIWSAFKSHHSQRLFLCWKAWCSCWSMYPCAGLVFHFLCKNVGFCGVFCLVCKLDSVYSKPFPHQDTVQSLPSMPDPGGCYSSRPLRNMVTSHKCGLIWYGF